MFSFLLCKLYLTKQKKGYKRNEIAEDALDGKGKESVKVFGIVEFEKLELKSFQKVWEHIFLESEKRKRYSNPEGVPKHGENKF